MPSSNRRLRQDCSLHGGGGDQRIGPGFHSAVSCAQPSIKWRWPSPVPRHIARGAGCKRFCFGAESPVDASRTGLAVATRERPGQAEAPRRRGAASPWRGAPREMRHRYLTAWNLRVRVDVAQAMNDVRDGAWNGMCSISGIMGGITWTVRPSMTPMRWHRAGDLPGVPDHCQQRGRSSCELLEAHRNPE